ncbi:MAG: Gfo/Idh/MocA family oxidoreductase, partial [Bryobacteraceae bacterium]
MTSHSLTHSLTRRNFLAGTGAVVATAATPFATMLTAAQGGKKLRVATVGTGSRGTLTWGIPVVKGYSDIVEFVGLCDINRKRLNVAKGIMGVAAPVFTDFDEMIRQTKPDAVIITTVDGTHWRYIVRALELGCDAITEKPMCTTEEQCQAILDVQKRTGRKVTVTFNARHEPKAKTVKRLLKEKAIGDIISVDFHEYLNTSHGADYFRRWHYLKENSGTLLVHKASHHFDQVNWWLESEPAEVSAYGALKVYGRNGKVRSTHCRVCPFKQQCKFHWDITTNKTAMEMFVACESEDGYLRDACVFRENCNIYDVMSVRVNYENQAVVTYTANTYIPYEGQSISFNGTKGRIDMNTFGGGGHKVREVRLTRTFGKSEVIEDFEPQRQGGHEGADTSIQDLVFRGLPDPDPLGLRAGLRAGAFGSLIGIAAYRSIER